MHSGTKMEANIRITMCKMEGHSGTKIEAHSGTKMEANIRITMCKMEGHSGTKIEAHSGAKNGRA